MDVVGLDIIEQTLVVGDEEHAALRRAHGVDALCNDLEGIDVEAGVGLVEDAVFRIEHDHLEDLVALFLTAGEAFVDGAGGEFAIHLQQIHLGVEVLVVGDGVDFLTLGEARLERGADEVRVGNAGDFVGVLEGEENPGAGALIDGQCRDIDAVHRDGSGGGDIGLVAGDDLGEGGLAGAVGPHDGVDFAGWNLKGDSLEDFGAVFEGGVEVLDVEAHIGEFV